MPRTLSSLSFVVVCLWLLLISFIILMTSVVSGRMSDTMATYSNAIISSVLPPSRTISTTNTLAIHSSRTTALQIGEEK